MPSHWSIFHRFVTWSFNMHYTRIDTARSLLFSVYVKFWIGLRPCHSGMHRLIDVHPAMHTIHTCIHVQESLRLLLIAWRKMSNPIPSCGCCWRDADVTAASAGLAVSVTSAHGMPLVERFCYRSLLCYMCTLHNLRCFELYVHSTGTIVWTFPSPAVTQSS